MDECAFQNSDEDFLFLFFFNVPCLGMRRSTSELGHTCTSKNEVLLWAAYWLLSFSLSSVSFSMLPGID